MSRMERRAALAVLWIVAICTVPAAAEGVVFYLAPGGNDAWSGRLAAPNAARTDGPWATLQRARDGVRQLQKAGPLPQGGVAVELAAGVYELAAPLELGRQDSGTAAAPIVYRARPKQEVRIVGGRVVTGWTPVSDPAVLARLDPAARGHVLQADLGRLGVKQLAPVAPGDRWGQSAAGLELFFQDQPMTVARWPNQGFVTIPKILGPTEVDIRGTKGCREGIFAYEGDRPSRWTGAKDLMLHGYWFWDWADQRLKVESIDTAAHVIRLCAKPEHHFGFRKGQWWYAYNLLEELDQPGEYFLDREHYRLYFWPPAAVTQGRPMISLLPTLVTMKDVSSVTLRGLTLECVQGTAVTIGGGDHNRLAGCVIRNVGSKAATISGTDNGAVGCDVCNTGDGGFTIDGGNRQTLTHARLFVENCHIQRFGRVNPIYKPAVSVSGVGNHVAHNLMHDAPHMAIAFSGNDHVIEFNEIHSVVYESNDAGVMYAGYNPTMRGHEIRYNYLHHIYGYQSRGCVGVYLDDMFCSAHIFGNVFYQVPRAAFIGGGRDSTIENNVFVDCKPAVHVDARALGWAAHGVEKLRARLLEMPYQQEPWRSRFPQLLKYLDDEPAVPKGNLIVRNVCWGGRWDEIAKQARPFVRFQDNLLDTDPRFLDAGAGNFQLRADSPAWKLGFQRIPIERIGLYASPDRATWPVPHTVRPAPEPRKTK
jgi:hypothetical protein